MLRLDQCAKLAIVETGPPSAKSGGMSEAFDYIIIGAGSAGCVLAARLTEREDCSVLLLEAGGPDKAGSIGVPIAFSSLFKTECDWDYETAPQRHLDGRTLYCPRGKVLGGSSAINAMIYIRGNRLDYDGWAAAGNDGWAFDDVLEYFKRAEDQQRGPSTYHGVGGPLRVEDQRDPNPMSLAFVEAAPDVGLERNEDFNGASQDGLGLYQVTQRRGKRCSAAAAYLKPASRHSNLSIRTGAHVLALVLEARRAVGARYLKDGQEIEVRAEREVLLCGGAINSPQVLMLSGIGPADDLTALEIPVVLDLPGVGNNLQDHPAVGVSWACKEPVSLLNAARKWNVIRYLLFRRGPLTSVVAEAGGFLHTRPGLDRPDLQLHVAPSFFTDHGLTEPKGHGFTIGPTLVLPEGRGALTLRSNDPLSKPSIDPGMLSVEADMKAMMAGIKWAREMAATPRMREFLDEEVEPGVEASDASALEAFVRARTEALYHPVGTCKMGTGADAVVDPQLRVRGIERLRVVDASIMPSVPGGNTNAPTIMIAEKAADLIAAAAG